MNTYTVSNNVSYSDSVNFSAGQPGDINPQWQYSDGTGKNEDFFQNLPADQFIWKQPMQPMDPNSITIGGGSINIGDIEIWHEGQLRLNEETDEIEIFEGGTWRVIGKRMDVPPSESEADAEEDDFELGGAL